MTFNEGARSSGPRATRRGRNTGIALGGGGIGVVLLFLIAQFTGVDLNGLLGGGGTTAPAGESTVVDCETGADANANLECRLDFTAQSLDAFWEAELGQRYTLPPFVLFDGAVSTGCGQASSAVGPFYCPPDQTVYLDTSFYGDLRTRFGAQAGSLSQMYVIAHEWGHHIQNITGIMDGVQRGDTGPTSDAVRLELQADCLAGAWVGAASTVPDASGTPYLEPVTDAQIADALDAAQAIGDDRIQASTQGQVNPETWTHGSSEQRQRWFLAGMQGGTDACDTFAVSGRQL